MASFSLRQWIAIATGVGFFTALFFINQKSPPKVEGSQSSASSNHVGKIISFAQVLDDAVKQIPASGQNAVIKLENALPGTPADNQAQIFNTIINIYDSLGAQLPATVYIEKLATLQNSADLWYHAGDRYYRSSQLVNPDARVAVLQKALDCFNNSLIIDSTNLDTKVGAGECIVQKAENPMQGIMMIESVLKKDSNNEKAQIALGAFSIQSGQYAKAIYRFNRVLQINPAFTEAYLYLAETYEGMGNKKESVRNLKKYNTFVTDSDIKVQVNSYIRKLENNNATN